MKERVSFALHIVVLFAILTGGVWAFISSRNVPVVQCYVVVVSVAAYIIWGLVYHFLNKRLTARIVLEYTLIGALALLLYSWTLFG